MTVRDWLAFATQQLTDAGVQTARLDALVLLEDVTGLDRSHLLAEQAAALPRKQASTLQRLLQRRCRHEPLAYIRGKAAFFGRDFLVDKHVLVPRPESETMIEQLKQLPLPPQAHLVDIGTGSGALGITAGLELPGTTITLVDIDTTALRVCTTNAQQHHLTATIKQSDLLANAPDEYDVVLANLPYVPDTYPINEAARHEPSLALFGGSDGLELYRRLFAQLCAGTSPPPFVLTESLPSQHAALTAIAEAAGYQLRNTEGFIQVFKAR